MNHTTSNTTTATSPSGSLGFDVFGYALPGDPQTWLVSGIVLVALVATVFLVLTHRAHAQDPDRQASVQRRLRETQAENARLHERNERLVASMREHKEALQALESRYRTVTESIPDNIRHYYEDGHHGPEGYGALERIARRERNAWAALDGTFHTGALASLFSAMDECLKAHRDGVHHQTAQEALERLAGVSQGLREDDWFAKALRWIEVQYGR